MKKSSWGCTVFIQLSLCLIVYVSLHFGHQSLLSSNDDDNAGALDLHFISVSCGFRPLQRQTRLLRLMERVAETYKAKFVVSTSEDGEEDLLLLNDTRVSSTLKLPWYTTKKGSGSFREHIELPFAGSLDVVFVDTGSLQKQMMSGSLNGSMISQLKELTKVLKAADGDWRIVVGSDPLFAYTLSNGPEEAKGAARTFQQITIKYGVNMYISEKGCSNGANEDSFTCIMVPNASENRGLTNDSERTLHSVDSASGWLETAFIETAMVNYPTPSNFMAPLPAYPVEQMCKIMDELPLDASNLERAFAAASLYYNYSGSESCFDMENHTDSHGLNGWGWQACTEMVMPMSCSNHTMFRPFESDDEKANQEYCLREYGVKPRPHWITAEFGGQRIEMVLKRFGSNIIFSNGLQDPWSGGGVLKNISSSIIALVTRKAGAHHTDLRAATKDDPEWLKQQRRQEVAIIEKWISEYYNDLEQEEQAK
ncbi:unnamed protein product [Brassica oleracea var. botrytis]